MFCCKERNSRRLRKRSTKALKGRARDAGEKENAVSSARGITAQVLAVVATIFIAGGAAGESAEAPPLQLEATIPLGDVSGRIDHMAVDLVRQRLFVAALGHGGLAVVDLKGQRLDRIIANLPEPQGVGFDPVTDML